VARAPQESDEVEESMIDGVTNPVNASTPAALRGEAPAGGEIRSSGESLGQTDAVELSPAAQQQLERDESAPIRANLVERVRAEIAAGTYLTDDKLEAAVNQMHAEVFATA
jgi:anti-sigma28 factor (negative regulator of flagellin synthesis)